MQSRRGALSRLRNATSIPLDKLEVLESDRKHRVDAETQAVNQALAMFPTTYYICTRNPKYIPMQHHIAYFIRNREIFDIFSDIYKIVILLHK